MRKATRSVQ